MASNPNMPTPGATAVAPVTQVSNYSEALHKILMGTDQRQHNLQAVKQKVEELYNGLNDITVALANISQPIIWHDVLAKFVVLSIQYSSIMQQLRGTLLKNAVVHPKLVDSSIMSSVLPLQLSTFPLPEMQQAEAPLSARVDSLLASRPVAQACVQLHEAIDSHNKLVDFLTIATSEPDSGVLDPQGKAVKELKAAAKKLTGQVNEALNKRAAAMQAGGGFGGAARKAAPAARGAAAKRKREPHDDLIDMFLGGQGLKNVQAPPPARR